MGEAKRRKLVGNTQPDPNWRRPLTKEERREAVEKGVKTALADVIFDYKDMIKPLGRVK